MIGSAVSEILQFARFYVDVKFLWLICEVHFPVSVLYTHIYVKCILLLYILFAAANLHILCAVSTYVQLFVSTKTRFGWQARDHQRSNDGITRAPSDNPPSPKIQYPKYQVHNPTYSICIHYMIFCVKLTTSLTKR